jgi:hypothetical protein
MQFEGEAKSARLCANWRAGSLPILIHDYGFSERGPISSLRI